MSDKNSFNDEDLKKEIATTVSRMKEEKIQNSYFLKDLLKSVPLTEKLANQAEEVEKEACIKEKEVNSLLTKYENEPLAASVKVRNMELEQILLFNDIYVDLIKARQQATNNEDDYSHLQELTKHSDALRNLKTQIDDLMKQYSELELKDKEKKEVE